MQLPHSMSILICTSFSLFFFTDTPTSQIYTLSLHDALPILGKQLCHELRVGARQKDLRAARLLADIVNKGPHPLALDRKSTRLNSSHEWISYAVFCLKKKRKTNITHKNIQHINKTHINIRYT